MNRLLNNSHGFFKPSLWVEDSPNVCVKLECTQIHIVKAVRQVQKKNLDDDFFKAIDSLQYITPYVSFHAAVLN